MILFCTGSKATEPNAHIIGNLLLQSNITCEVEKVLSDSLVGKSREFGFQHWFFKEYIAFLGSSILQSILPTFGLSSSRAYRLMTERHAFRPSQL